MPWNRLARPGFTFLEVAMAMVVLLLGMAGIVAFTNGLLRQISLGGGGLQADPQVGERMMQDQVEAVRAWNGFAGAPPLVNPLAITGGGTFAPTLSMVGGPNPVTAGYGSPVIENPGLVVSVLVNNGSDSLGGFSSTPLATMGTTRDSHVSAIIGSNLVVVGGESGATWNSGALQGGAEQAPISASGTLGAFSPVAGVALVNPRRSFTCQVIGPYLYVMGGFTGTQTGSVERASIAGGVLGNFTTAGIPALGTVRDSPCSVVIGNYLYVMGGWDGVGPSTVVERSTIAPDGTIGAFTTAGVSQLSTGRHACWCQVVGNRLYVMGGGSNTTVATSVESAPINSDGTLGAFASGPVLLTATRLGAACAVVGGNLYVLGGRSGGATVATGERAPIRPDGTLGAFQALPAAMNLDRPRVSATLALIGTKLMAVGGFDTASLGTVVGSPFTGVISSVLVDKLAGAGGPAVGL